MTAPGRYLSFDAVAGDYDQTRVIPDAPLEEIARLVAREAGLDRGGLFLDAGVGTGRFAAPLSRLHPAQIVGVDIAPNMMARVAGKVAPGSLSLTQADLQRLPFRTGGFQGALLVHILHLIEQWPLVLRELRRVLEPPQGALLLGGEQGGRSLLVDFYFGRARARHVLGGRLGSSSLSPVITYLRRTERTGGGGAKVFRVLAPGLEWKRTVPPAQTLESLSRRTYSQMWPIEDADHREIMAETEAYAARIFASLDAPETLSAQFVLYAIRWPETSR